MKNKIVDSQRDMVIIKQILLKSTLGSDPVAGSDPCGILLQLGRLDKRSGGEKD